MKRISPFLRMAGLALGLALTPGLALADSAEKNILLWMVYDNYDDPMVPDTSPTDVKYIDELISRPDGYSVNGARLRVAGTDTYVDLYENGVADPLLNQMLPIRKDPVEGVFIEAGPVWSYLADYTGAEYSFLVELGHWGEDDKWTVMATSRTVSFEELWEGGWTTATTEDRPRHGPWTPTFAVPEPTSGLLVVIGGALLALRRRRAGRSGRAPYRDGRATRSVAPTKGGFAGRVGGFAGLVGGCAGLVGRTLRVRRRIAAGRATRSVAPTAAGRATRSVAPTKGGCAGLVGRTLRVRRNRAA